MKRRIQNTLLAGVLGAVLQNRPDDQKYAMGCEVADGCLPLGDRLIPAPAFTPLEPYTWKAQLCPPPDVNYYYGNVIAPNQATDQQSSAPSVPIGYTKTLRQLLRYTLASGNYAARKGAPGVSPSTQGPGSDGGCGYWQGPFTGNSFPFWGGTGGGISASQAIYNPDKINYVRAVEFLNQSSGQLEWGIICDLKITGEVGYTNSYVDSVHHDYYNVPQTVVLGRGGLYSSNDTRNTGSWGASNHITVNVAVTPHIFTFPTGYLTLTEPSAIGLTLVGYNEYPSDTTGKVTFPWANVASNVQPMYSNVGYPCMFPWNASHIVDYSYHQNAGNSNTDGFTVGSTIGVPFYSNDPFLSDCWVLAYGTPGSNSSYMDPNNAGALNGNPYDPYDYLAQGLEVPVSVANSPTNTTTNFSFVNARQIVVGGRRMGKASYPNGTSGNPPLVFGLGVTEFSKNTGASGANNTIQTTYGDTIPTDPYFLILPGGPPEWVEHTYSGVVIGTQNGEYSLENEQMNPGALSYTNQIAGCSARKCSATGTPLTCDDKKAISCQLGGTIVFCTYRGVAILEFDMLRRQYRPRIVDLIAMGFGAATSIASSRSMGLIFIQTKGCVVVLNPETGAITTLSYPVGPVTDPAGNVYGLYGLDTYLPASGAAGSLATSKLIAGEPVWVFYNNATQTFKQCAMQLPAPGVPAMQSTTIRTSRFGAAAGTLENSARVWIDLIATRGGRVRIAKPRSEGYDNPYQEINYNQVQYGDPTDPTEGFSGVMEAWVDDRKDVKSEGKAVELNFLPTEPYQLCGVAVEIEEVP